MHYQEELQSTISSFSVIEFKNEGTHLGILSLHFCHYPCSQINDWTWCGLLGHLLWSIDTLGWKSRNSFEVSQQNHTKSFLIPLKVVHFSHNSDQSFKNIRFRTKVPVEFAEVEGDCCWRICRSNYSCSNLNRGFEGVPDMSHISRVKSWICWMK